MNLAKPLLLLDRERVAALLDMPSCIAAVEEAFALHASGNSLAPSLLHVDAPGGEFHVKAGGLGGERPVFACKINGAFAANRARGLPTIIGMIVLSDASNGMPLAILESGWITETRTGAASAVAAKYLARPDSAVVTICGAGRQAAVQLRALTEVLPLRRALIWARSDATAFAAGLADELGISVEAVADLGAATRQSDVIVTCTPADGWFLGVGDVRPGTFIAAVGADSPHKQELEPALVAKAAVVCDLTGQCAKVGELHHAIQAGLMTVDQVRAEIGQAIIGGAPGRVDDEEITLFDSTGTALQDAAAAARVVARAQESGLG